MRIVGVSELEVGDVLEKSVQGNNGVVMLEAGTVLTEKYINRLKTLRIKFVHLSDSLSSERSLLPSRSVPPLPILGFDRI